MSLLQALHPQPMKPDHPEGQPPRGAACFSAPSRFGPLLFELAGGVRHAADAAIALQRCEPLLTALHDWTGIAHEWRWTDRSRLRLTADSYALARWQITDHLHGLVELPWALMRSLSMPPASLAQCLTWPTLPAVLSVSRFRLSIDELRQLEPGGAVVLPESLTAPWHGFLRAAAEPAQRGLGVPVDLSSPALPCLAPAVPTPAQMEETDMRVACEVRLGLSQALPVDRLGGWCTGETLDEICASATLWRCAGARPARLATGRLMPWGNGWALAIESLDAAEPDATLITQLPQ